MGKVFTPVSISSGFNTSNSLNTNFDNIETALEDCLSRSGAAPNAMSADLDMNDNDILNVRAIDVSSITVDGEAIPSLEDINDAFSNGMVDINAAVQLAEDARDSAQGYSVDAGISAASAEQYAIEPEDSEIAPGIYSALHYAAKAAQSAAGVNLPSVGAGDAYRVLVVNQDEDGFELSGKTSAASEAGTFVYRNSTDATYEAATPTQPMHAANKSYVDGLLESSGTTTGFVKSVAKYTRIETDLPGDNLDIASDITINDLTTIGPTGSGADYIWGVLNNIPSDAKTVTLVYKVGGYDTTAGEYYTAVNLGIAGPSDIEYTHYAYVTASSSYPTLTTSSPIDVILQGDRTFKIRWNSSYDTPLANLYLTGFTV